MKMNIDGTVTKHGKYSVVETNTSFVWLAINGVVHAFAGRKSFCVQVRLPPKWLHLGREGAICLNCSRALRERAELRKLV